MEEEQAREDTDFGVTQYQQADNESNLVIQTDPKHILKRIERILGRLYQNEQGEWVKDKNVKPMINREGLNSLMVDAEGVINQNTIMSNLNEKEISRIILALGDTLITKLLVGSEDWDIEDKDIETILFTIVNMAYIALKRGYGEGERRFLKTSVRSHEMIRINPNQPEQMTGGGQAPSGKKSFWGKIFN